MSTTLPWATVDDFIASLESVTWYSQGPIDPRWTMFETADEARLAELEAGGVEVARDGNQIRAHAQKSQYAIGAEDLHAFYRTCWRLWELKHKEAQTDAAIMALAVLCADTLAPELVQYALDSWVVWLAGYRLYYRSGDKFYVCKGE